VVLDNSLAVARGPEVRRVAVFSLDPKLLSQLQPSLAENFQVRPVPSHRQLVPLLKEVPVHCVVLDIDQNGIPHHELLQMLLTLRRAKPELVLIAVTRSPRPDLKIHVLKVGADECCTAPIDVHELKSAIMRALDKRSIDLDNRQRGEQLGGGYSFFELIGGSDAMRRVYDSILRVAPSNTSVVIRGESGTGKELIARSIVALSPRRDKPFVSLNCAALPEHLIEAELFGHEKGAFTGAVASKPGQIELADGGTLFLDEIATLTLALQSKLLRVLEERTVQRLGGQTLKRIDFRLVTATHENLEQMVKDGRFREDLYYRIHVVPISLPPLRERPGDIALLADHFLRIYCAANQLPLKRLDLETLEVLEESPWPGNVRELENLIQRLVLMVEGRNISVQHLPQQILSASASHHEALLIPDEGIDFDNEMTRIEAAYVQAALRRAGGKKVVAAALLRVNAQRMKYLCRKHRIESS
jgi:DNA-binding NtrC family response regulator